MKEKTKFRFILFFICCIATLLALILPSPPHRPQPEVTLCSGWEDGWRREPELAGIAAAIKTSRLGGDMEWPKNIKEAADYGKFIFSSSPCQEKMPEISREVHYPVDGWNCDLLPNGVPPNTHYDRGKNRKNIPDDLVLLRCISTTEPKRILDFLWEGKIVESSD
jgi:hypothetical protein